MSLWRGRESSCRLHHVKNPKVAKLGAENKNTAWLFGGGDGRWAAAAAFNLLVWWETLGIFIWERGGKQRPERRCSQICCIKLDFLNKKLYVDGIYNCRDCQQYTYCSNIEQSFSGAAMQAVEVTDQLVHHLHPSLLFTTVEVYIFFLDKLLSVINDQSQISFGLGFIIEKVPKSSKAADRIYSTS
jgi:hypothetical protein